MLISVNLSEVIAPHFYSITYDILAHKYTHYWFSGGRGSTKSSNVSVDIILLMLRNEDVNVLALRKVGATLRESVYNQILWAIDKLRVSHLFKTTSSPLEITYIPTGQKIYFRGADKDIKIKSIKAKKGYIGVVWFEEADQFNTMEEIRSILQSANRGGGGFWNFYSYNPPKSRDSWVNSERLEEYEGKIHNHSTYQTVPIEWLGEEFINAAELLKERKPTAYEHEYLGIPTGTGGAVFDNIEERTITDKEYASFDRFKFGMDFGVKIDETAWVKLYYDKARKYLYILDEIYEQRLKPEKAAEKIRQKHKGSMMITGDSAAPLAISIMRELGINMDEAKKGAGSRDFGYKFLQDLEKIIIDKHRTPNAYKEFSLYEYPMDRNGNYISIYPDKCDHILDAVRYAMESEMRNSRIHTSNFKLWG